MPKQPVSERTISTGIFERREIRMSGSAPSVKHIQEFVRRHNADAMQPLGALEEHAVLLVRRFGRPVARRPLGYIVLPDDPNFLKALPKGIRVLKATKVAWGEPGSVSLPQYTDACDILCDMTVLRYAVERGDQQSVIKAAVRLGVVATRLKVRPYEDDARIGRSLADGQRKRAMKRYQDTSRKDESRIAAFDRIRPNAGSDNDAVNQAADEAECSANTIRNALRRAGRPLPKHPSRGKANVLDSLQRRRS